MDLGNLPAPNKADSFIPLTMAAINLLLLMYFKAIGGYRPLRIEEAH